MKQRNSYREKVLEMQIALGFTNNRVTKRFAFFSLKIKKEIKNNNALINCFKIVVIENQERILLLKTNNSISWEKK